MTWGEQTQGAVILQEVRGEGRVCQLSQLSVWVLDSGPHMVRLIPRPKLWLRGSPEFMVGLVRLE